MKCLALIVIGLFSYCVCVAQSKYAKLFPSENKSWISIGAGVAIPMDNYGSTNFRNPNAGMAKVGFGCSADLAIPLHSNMGVIFSLNGFINPCEEKEVSTVIKARTGYTPDVNFTSWKAGSTLFGVYLKTASTQGKAAFYVKLLGGYAFTQSPELSIFSSNGITYSHSTQSSAIASTWAFNTGLGVVIPLSASSGFQLGVNYMKMKSNFNNVEAKIEEGNMFSPFVQRYSTTTDYSMTMTNILINVSVIWYLH